MTEAKEAKIDVDNFKIINQKKDVIEQEYGPSGMFPQNIKYDFLSGWFLTFFAYYKQCGYGSKKIPRFEQHSIKVEEFN